METLPEAVAILSGNDKCLDHLSLFKIAAKLVQFVEPELVTLLVRFAPEIPEILHHHEHLVGLCAGESFILDDLPQYGSARRPPVQGINQRIAVAVEAGSVSNKCVDKSCVAQTVISCLETWTLDPGPDKGHLI